MDRPVPLPRLSPDTRRPEYLRQINPSLIVIDEVAIMSNLTIPPTGVYPTRHSPAPRKTMSNHTDSRHNRHSCRSV
ncbi:Hypothetical protein PFR_JS7-2_1959 [Propionibacterium freudenreichii]|nr:Hypothetical protein PFR_JS7-1_2017 [Propionibacterium freudenreichii]SCQ54615.1 Hypothetical protein PFR_JS7-2_1959 [Propionibacterium freudenreichii]